MTGVLCLDKDKDITSFFALSLAKREFGEKKAGHMGTLDPMATGVLPLFLGGATRFIPFIQNHRKRYIAEIRAGITTNTLDITGEVLAEKAPDFTKENLIGVLQQYKGKFKQTPPMFSAIQQNGVRLYDLARKGVEVTREARDVEVFDLQLLSFNPDTHTFILDIYGEKGFYVRSLAQSIGEDLGCGAVLTALRRTMAGDFALEQAITLTDIRKTEDKNRLLIPVDTVLKDYPKIDISELQANRFCNGGELFRNRIHQNINVGLYRVYAQKRFLGLGEVETEESSVLKVKKVYIER